jgi:ATP-dependent helicase HrpB
MKSADLPIYAIEAELVRIMQRGNRLVLEAPTGSGKSTQVPQMLLDRGVLSRGEVVVLQPRRLPARMLAARVASERGSPLGHEVGYQIRLDKVCSKNTRIRYVTEGVLLRQMLADPCLEGVEAVCFDEFHERHLYGDITLARALEIQESLRPDLKVIVMSATLDSGKLEEYLRPCETLSCSGRAYPVDVRYLPRFPEKLPVWELIREVFETHAPHHDGDVLIFLPGSYEIQRTIQVLRESGAARGCDLLPLHGELSPREQDAAVARSERRKVIVSTNVAETSLTIEGVRMVIDSGLAKIARFDPYRGINTLLQEFISRASADQRAGRAGRTAPGVCFRLWTEKDHLSRPAQELPEVRRLDLAEVVLTLKACGISDPARFRWLEAPDPKGLDRALRLLVDLGALSSAGELTGLGRRMLAFPVHPRYARMLLAADQYGCVSAVARAAALTQGRSVLRRAENREMEQQRDAALSAAPGSDLFVLLSALKFAEENDFQPSRCQTLGIHAVAAREAAALARQFLQIARAEGLRTETGEAAPDAIQRCVLAGFPDQVAHRLDHATLRCHLVHARKGVLARESSVHGYPLLVACEIREIESKGAERQVLLTLATGIERAWLREIFPDAFSEKTEVIFDAVQRRVLGKQTVRFHDLVLQSRDTDEVPPEAAAALLASEVLEGRCILKEWNDEIENWITRINLVSGWAPEWGITPVSDADRRLMIEQVCWGATSYREVKERPVWPVLKTWLSSAQTEAVEKLAPERFSTPNGRRFKVQYSETAAPAVGVRIQDLYGVEGEMRICGGKIPLVIQVLAPNHRPIQITQNLSNFWKESYPRIKQELQRKYPKHEWR